ncbi:hypothetical protein VPNG_08050 [Cytospora leucostoma]|uniref:Efflux pump dotC n=1 Tax=Cytospora leucostoma TaxID=1230097 RepID=A0A423WSL2_9PEZI|nr:hypothetical protein VPNG_08050 [Cytospora leucostoma]
MADGQPTQGVGDVDSQTSATTASGHNTSPDTFHEKQNLDKQAHSTTNTHILDIEGGQDQAAPAEPVAAAPKPDPSPAQEPSAVQLAIIVVPLCAALFLAALDITIVTTALPTIVADFDSSAGYTWIGSAYLLTNAAFTPTWGKLSDIWGRKPILLLVAFIFFVGSTLAATSVSISMLIVARCIQGLGGGGIVVLVNICVSELVSPRKRGQYLGYLAIVWALASALGPILGGAFTQRVTWRWCFYINLPITGVVFIVLCFLLHVHNPRTPIWDGLAAIDWLGSLTITGGTLMLLLGLNFGGVTFSWDSAAVICLIIFGLVVLISFFFVEWKLPKYPIVPLRIFKQTSNVAALVLCFSQGFCMIGGSYYLPLYFQAVLGAQPLLSGVYLLPYAISFSMCSFFTGILIRKTGQYLPTAWTGIIIMTLGFGLLVDLPDSAYWPKIILYQLVAGIGVGANLNAPLVALQANVNPGDIAPATATFFFTRVLSSAVSVVIGGVVFQNQMQKHFAELVLTLGPDTAGKLAGSSASTSVGIVNGLPREERRVARAAYHDSLRIMWIVYVAFAAVGMLASAFVSKKVLSATHNKATTGLKAEEEKRKAAGS